jgi:hypothetical protein
MHLLDGGTYRSGVIAVTEDALDQHFVEEWGPVDDSFDRIAHRFHVRLLSIDVIIITVAQYSQHFHNMKCNMHTNLCGKICFVADIFFQKNGTEAFPALQFHAIV